MIVAPHTGSEVDPNNPIPTRPPYFKCEFCKKEFTSEAQLAFHRDIEHVKHLPLSGVA
jgi:hypothetical protein